MALQKERRKVKLKLVIIKKKYRQKVLKRLLVIGKTNRRRKKKRFDYITMRHLRGSSDDYPGAMMVRLSFIQIDKLVKYNIRR